MNTLVINGSPKGDKSNTLKLTKSFLEGAGLSRADIINIYAKTVNPCRGCFYCWNKTPGKCVIADDMADIIEKIVATDMVIWSTPLYYFSVPGTLKNLLDRLLPLCLPFMSENNESGGHFGRYDLSHQRHAVISTCGFWTAKGNYGGVELIFDRLYGDGGYAKIFCGQGELFRVKELSATTDAYLQYVKEAGAEFARQGKISGATEAKLQKPLFARETFEKMADESWGIERQGAGAQKTDAALSFTKQMAALYTPDGKQRVLEFEYTDIGKTYQAILNNDGATVISQNFMPYTTKITTPLDVWQKIGRGEISGQEALYRHMFSVDGDFSVMLDWEKLFSGTKAGEKNITAKVKKTNMLALLIPWIVLWTAVPINAGYGGVISVLTAALIPLLWIFIKPVIYEQITVPIVVALSLCAAFGANTRVIIPLSYGLFGMMWLVTAFFKVPLTAYYSANDYGQNSAFKNPLFMRTNRVLTAFWGILYIITTFWTYALMGTGASVYTGLINSAAPLLMGIFTAWFQKWYPRRWAKIKPVV